MEKVGVMAVVEGLSQFNSSMKSIDKTIRGLVPGANLVQAAFQKLGNFFTGIFSSAIHIVEYALGNLLAGAIRNVIQSIKDMIGSVIEAGKNFQTLSIRLNRLNFNEVSKTVDDYTTAMDKAKEMTQENLKWLQKLAVMSPYDADDVALVYTMARSYGFASTQAQSLTEDTLNFAAGMGLTADHIKRIIYNFGQMEAAQKVTGRELRDLANSFVPVNDILLKMQENTGLTGDAFDDFRNSAEGVDMFLAEFSKLVGENYAGASADLARTFEFATQNAKDLLQSLLGLSVVKPVLDTLGGKMADFIDALTSGGRFEVLQTLFGRIGESISRIVEGILGMGPSTDDMVTGILKGVLHLADWLETHEDDIVGFFKNIADKIRDDVIPWIKDKLIPSVQEFIDKFAGNKGTDFFTRLKDSVLEMAPPIQGVAEAIGNIIQTIQENPEVILGVVDGIAGALQTAGDAAEKAAPYIEQIITWLSENSDTVGKFVTGFLILQGVWLAIVGILGILMPILTALGIVIGIIALVASSAALPFIALGIIIVSLAVLIYKNWDKIKEWTKKTWDAIWGSTEERWEQIKTKVSEVATSIWQWIKDTFQAIVDDVKEKWAAASDATKTAWENMKTVIRTAWETIKTTLNNAISDVQEWIDGILSYMDEFVDDFGKKGYNAAQKFLLSMIGTLNKVVDLVKPIIAAILNALGPLLNLTVKVSVETKEKPGGPCFTGETHVLQPDGKTIPIEEAVEGTPVMCWDGNGSLRETVVTEHIVHESELRTVWNVEFVSGTHFDVTPNHVVRSNGRWVKIGELTFGDTITNWRMEEDAITNIVPRKDEVPVYNLHVEDEQHNYIAEGLIVHNYKPKPPDVSDTASALPSNFPTPLSTTSNVTNNFSVNFGNAANPEPILADFATLQSLVGL